MKQSTETDTDLCERYTEAILKHFGHGRSDAAVSQARRIAVAVTIARDEEMERLRAELAGMERRAGAAEDAFRGWEERDAQITAERDALEAAVELAREEAARWRDDLKDNTETWAVNVRHVCAMLLAALVVPESHEDA